MLVPSALPASKSHHFLTLTTEKSLFTRDRSKEKCYKEKVKLEVFVFVMFYFVFQKISSPSEKLKIIHQSANQNVGKILYRRRYF